MADLALIRKNIGTMIDRGAPDQDITAYVASEGVTPDMVKAPLAQGDGKGGFADFKAITANNPYVPSTFERGLTDVSNQFQKGLAEGVPALVSGPAQLAQTLAYKSFPWINTHILGGTESPDAVQASIARVQAANDAAPLNPANYSNEAGAATGIGPAQTTAGKYANTVGQFVPGSMLGGGSVAQKLAGAVGGGLSSEAAGQATAGTKFEPYARLGGAVIGGGLANAAVDYMGQKIPEGQTFASTKMLRDALPEDQSAFDKLGPNARVLDSSPSMTGLAQGVAQQPSVAKNKLFEALKQDEAGRSNRLVSGTESVLGPYESPALNETAVNAGIKQNIGPMYDAARQGSTGFDPVIQGNILNKAQGIIAKEGPDAKAYLMDKVGELRDRMNMPNPTNAVHELRVQLDSEASRAFQSGDNNAGRLASAARGIVDEAMQNVPGWKEADAKFAAAKQSLEARQYGYDALGGGARPISPEQFTSEIQGKSLPDIQQGMNANVRDAMGTSSNDFSALKNRVGGPNAYNREKLNQAYGSDVSGKLGSLIDAEAQMSANRNKIMAGSNTASNLSAEKLVNTPEMGAVPSNITMLGVGAKVAEKTVRSVVNNVLMRSSQSTRDALVEALMKQGPDARAMLNEIEASQPGTSGKLLRALAGAASGSQSIQGPSYGNSR